MSNPFDIEKPVSIQQSDVKMVESAFKRAVEWTDGANANVLTLLATVPVAKMKEWLPYLTSFAAV